MKKIDKIYVNGEFGTPHGKQIIDLISLTTNREIAEVI
jgi:aldehyde dehydrogenase (NAD+)